MIDQRVELQCGGCKTRIKVRLRGDRVVPSIPCPSCKLPIPVPQPAAESADEHPTAYGGEPSLKRVDLRRDDSRFKDVGAVGVDRELLAKDRDFSTAPKPRAQARPPLPEDRPRSKAPTAAADRGSVHQSRPTASVSAEPDVRVFADEDLDRGLHLFVEGVDYGVVGAERLEQIVSSGVWLGAIEIEEGDSRVSMDRHPALPVLKSRLAAKAKNAVDKISHEWDRDELPAPTHEPPKRRSAPVVAVVLVAFATVAIGLAVWAQKERPDPKPIDPQPVVSTPVAPPEATLFATDIAKRALTISTESARLRDRDPGALLEQATSSLQRSNFGDALDALHELRRRNAKDVAVLEMLSRAQLGTRRFREARETVVAIAALGRIDATVTELFREAVQRDRAFDWVVKEVGKDVPVDIVKALGGGKSVSFKFKRNGKNVYAFKPGQRDWEEGWRGEIAAYRFCELATCGFRIPESVPVKISRRTLERLYPRNSDFQNAYAERFDEIDWKTEATDRGSEQYAYGVMKSWVPHFADWPIEYTDVWIDWLNPTVDGTTTYDLPISEGIASVKDRNPETWRALRKEFSDASVADVAAQISNVLLFDFLINNWDRFSEREEYYGVNNQFADGRFVSIDNGAGFGLRHSTRVEERFSLVGRFSRSMVASLELIAPKYQGVLMPNPSESEKLRMALFWERREQALKRVKQRAKGRRDKVLAFE